ncbi:MAG: OmpA family protein [Deltaproteobacteria bacterium]|nr:OmpA family protein [Deltaproteobacteria bacterium]
MRTNAIIAAISALALVGCVSSGKHEKLQKKYKDAQATIEARDAKVKKLEGNVKTLEEEIKDLEAEKKKLGGQIKALGDQKAQIEGELAAVVKDKTRLKASAEKLKQALGELQARETQATARLNQLRILLSKFKALIDAGKLQVKIVDGRMVLVLPSDVLFESGRAKLGDEGATAIAEVAKVLATLRGRQFQIEGHTDNVPIKTRRFPSNWHLASARAITVVEAMISAGVSPKMLSAASYGEVRPAARNDSNEGKRANRRIEIVLVPDLSQLPGFDELNKAVKN